MSDETPCCEDRKVVLVEIRGVYDGGLFYMCDTCKAMWHRWGANAHRLHAQAQEVMDQWEANRQRLREALGTEDSANPEPPGQ
jgi:hypothetical protein